MARIRSIHPSLFTGDSFMEATENPMACLFLIGLWGQADDKGAFEWKPASLKARILPATGADGAKLLDFLAGHNLIAPYEVDGRKYGAIRKFGLFQRPKKPNDLYPMPTKWRIYAATDKPSSALEGDDGGGSGEPEPGEQTEVPNKYGTSTEPGAPNPQASTEKPEQMEDVGCSKEEEVRGSLRSPRAREADDADFEAFWRAYPRKVAKGHTRKAFASAIKKTSVSAILEAIQRAPWDARERFIPHPATWLNGERWADEVSTGDPTLRAAGLLDGQPDWLKLEAGRA